MARVETDTGREVFIAEGQHFCNRQFGEQRDERERGGEVGKEKWRDQQVFTPDGASTTVERRDIESEALLCNDRTLKGRPLLLRELRRVLEEEEEVVAGEWEKMGGGGGGSEMEQKLPTAVVQHAQQMLYFGKQRV